MFELFKKKIFLKKHGAILVDRPVRLRVKE